MVEKINRKGFRGFLQNLDSELRMFILALMVGVISGFGAILFRKMIAAVQDILFNYPNEAIFKENKILVVIAPMIGGLIVGAIVHFYAREAKGHGVPEIIQSVNVDGGRMRYRVPFVKIISSAITIGSGGSAGREGPIAQIGGGFASVLGMLFHLNEEERKTLVISGVAGGIAATFNAPLGGVLFGLEIIRRDKKSFPIMPLIVTSVVGTSISVRFLGTSPSFIFPEGIASRSAINIPFFVILGLIMGVLGMLWVKSFYSIEDIFEKIPANPIIVTGFGGFLVGLMELYYPEVTGTTYAPIDAAFALEFSITTLLILAFLKFLATSFTLGAGGSGGVFAPTLFMGVMLGSAYGLILQSFGLDNAPIVVYALLGMAALFAGSSHAPLTAIVMTAEMVGDYQLFIPLMLAVAAAWVVSRQLSSDDIYIVKLKRRGVNVEFEQDLLEQLFVEDIMVRDIVTVSPKDRLEYVIDLMNETGHTGFPVVVDDQLVGIITEHDINNVLRLEDVRDWDVFSHCTKNVATILPDCPLSFALIHMDEENINRFPVVKSKGSRTLVGWVTRSDIMHAYRNEKRNAAHKKFENDLFDQLEENPEYIFTERKVNAERKDKEEKKPKQTQISD